MCLKGGRPQLSSQEVNRAWSKPFRVLHSLCQWLVRLWRKADQRDFTGRLGQITGKGFLFPKKERWEEGRRRKEGRKREGRIKGGRVGLSSAGHSYLDVVLWPSCYQGKSKAGMGVTLAFWGHFRKRNETAMCNEPNTELEPLNNEDEDGNENGRNHNKIY